MQKRSFPGSIDFVVLFIAGLTPLARAQNTVSAPAVQSAIIQADGPKQGPSGEKYFNVEGKGKGKYADFGVVRFDVSHVKSDLDKKLGAGKYKVTGIQLRLAQSNAGFTSNGSVSFYFSPDDTTEIKEKNSPLKYPYMPSGQALKGKPLGSGKFEKPATDVAKGAADEGTSKKPHGLAKVNEYNLLQGQSGQADLMKHVLQGRTVTIVISEAEAGVAATWAGGKSAGALSPPVLVITAVPAHK